MSPIDEIKARLDIVDIIGESVQLRKAGKNFTGFCPFHANTRTPAFTVFPDTQSFYCFGCHASGTVFDFVMRKQGLDFGDALRQLAARAGVELTERSVEEQQQDQQRTRLLEINAAAAKYFNYILLSMQRGQPARDYLEQRSINAETIEAFQLGYSLEEWSHLLNYLTDRKGFTPEEVESAGLAIQREQGGYYDRFRGRLIFPIRNARGEVVGFGGRALGDAQPKYLNSPQTPLFDKSNVLYGLDLARDAIRSADATVVVEGYVDVLTAHQHGFRNVVAPLGTALTAGHVTLLKKLSHNVYLALDADAAGQRATLRSLSILQQAQDEETTRSVVTAQGLVRWESDVSLRIIKMPPGQDPDEVIKADPQRWRDLVANAVPVVDFYIDAYTADLNLSSPQDQTTALDRLLPLLAELDGAQQRVYIARLEQLVGVKAELIVDLLREQRGTKGREQRRTPTAHRSPPATEASAHTAQRKTQHLTREDHLLALLLRYPATQATVEQLVAQDLQAFPQVRELFGDGIAGLLERTENRMLWQQRPGLDDQPSATADNRLLNSSDLEAWLQELDPSLRDHAARLIRLELPKEYRYRQEAEANVRNLRIEQARRWQRHLSRQAHALSATANARGGDETPPDTALEPEAIEAEYQRLVGLMSELQRYLSTLTTPRRSSSFPDLRDTLKREA